MVTGRSTSGFLYAWRDRALLVTMAILYSVLVEHINADDNNFLADKLRAVRADLAEKKVGQGELLADDVPIGASDYFVRVLDPQTGQVAAERTQMGGRPLPPSVFPSSPADVKFRRKAPKIRLLAGNGFC